MSRTMKFYSKDGELHPCKLSAWKNSQIERGQKALSRAQALAVAGKKGFVYTKDGKRDTRRFVFPKEVK